MAYGRPQPGDVLIRNVGTTQYELVDASTHERLAGPFAGFADTLYVARMLKPRAIWQRDFDESGEPVNELLRLPMF